MAQIEETLERLGAIVAEFEMVAQRRDANLVKDVLKLREQYTGSIAQLFGAVKTDPRLTGNPEVAGQFAAKFQEFRHYISALQTRWRVAEIEADPMGYLKEIKAISTMSVGVRQWGKDTLAKLAA